MSLLCRLCVAIFIFFEGSGNFLKTIFLALALQALWQSFGLRVGLCGFGNVLANRVGHYVNTSLINFFIVRFSSLDAIGDTLSKPSFQCIPSL